MFKKKINYQKLLELILIIGQKRFEVLKEGFNGELEYNSACMYYIWQIINCFLIERMLQYKNILNEKDIVMDILKLLVESTLTNTPDDLHMELIQIVMEIKDIWQYDDDTNSHNELYNTANYFINEITNNNDDSKLIVYKKFIEQYLIDCHFQNKNILLDFKIQTN